MKVKLQGPSFARSLSKTLLWRVTGKEDINLEIRKRKFK
jgi:hypothetical protein